MNSVFVVTFSDVVGLTVLAMVGIAALSFWVTDEVKRWRKRK